jgi:hypothetical protein
MSGLPNNPAASVESPHQQSADTEWMVGNLRRHAKRCLDVALAMEEAAKAARPLSNPSESRFAVVAIPESGRWTRLNKCVQDDVEVLGIDLDLGKALALRDRLNRVQFTKLKGLLPIVVVMADPPYSLESEVGT